MISDSAANEILSLIKNPKFDASHIPPNSRYLDIIESNTISIKVSFYLLN